MFQLGLCSGKSKYVYSILSYFCGNGVIMAKSLISKTCVPCQGGIAPLSLTEAKGLINDLPDWDLKGSAHHLYREFKFNDFAAALSFANKVGNLAEKENHHPDIKIGWGYVVVEIFTHKIDGLHENDFILAAKVDQLPH